MTDSPARRSRLTLEAEDAADPAIGWWLAALTNTRKRTLAALHDLPDGSLDVVIEPERNSIGTLLYHVALIEADWLFDEILGTIDRDWPKDLFPVPHRDEGGVLSPLDGETLAEHLSRLEAVRAMLVDAIRTMTIEDVHTPRVRDDYDVSPAWVLHHLMQHEAEHRAQVSALRDRLPGSARQG